MGPPADGAGKKARTKWVKFRKVNRKPSAVLYPFEI